MVANRASSPPPPPSSAPPPSPSGDYGNFVYISDGPSQLKMTFTTTNDGYGVFSIDCGREPFEDGPFPLRREPEQVRQVHEFPDDFSDERLVSWLTGVEKACPHLNLGIQDLLGFYINSDGDLGTQLGGNYVVLKREWLPLSPGRYMTNSSMSRWTIQYDIHPDNAVYVRFQISVMSDQGPGKEYRLTAYPGRNTVDDLVTKFKSVCPMWTDYFDFYGSFITAGFATPDVVYAFGNYEKDRLFKQPL
ncbi:hypothetical protein FOL47_001867 [Perkinsus chesapeaki]|uniref:Uncharacterized protein n=1 Tax=Perkinsus chesapeaki TaxID=330153 RepID=A0A7J6MGJ2_PERCH|nr:hypothetical protein FOL47_001867 [Perkinsus chesapeaki]